MTSLWTRFIDDDNVEARGTRIEILDHSGKWHHPNRDSAAALRHFPRGFGSQQRNTYPVAFANPPNCI